jgi:hypothetical protein
MPASSSLQHFRSVWTAAIECAREDEDHSPDAPPITQAFCSSTCAGVVLKECSPAFFSPGAAYKNISLLKTLKGLVEANSPQELCLN